MSARLVRFATSIALSFVFVSDVFAVATYGTHASSDFSLTIPTFSTGGTVSGSAVIDSNTGTSATGGTGVALHLTDLITADGTFASYKRVITISGSASAPPDSHASSNRMTGHLFTIDNHRTDPVDIPFVFSMAWTVLVSADDPANESASSGAFFSIAGIDTEELFIGGLKVTDFEHEIGLSTTSGSGGVMSDLMILGTLHLTPGRHMFSVITDAAGRATASTVPEPATLLLVAFGALAALRRRH
ncbi:MAG: PEP-CTERM sorting domain-containing protein [Burkholderiales bacterium]|nr:PEP-CTERM sorting domain-containing protein [Burkholderiales bacterium]